MNEPRHILESRDERLTHIWIGVGLVSAVLFLFIRGHIYNMIENVVNVFGE